LSFHIWFELKVLPKIKAPGQLSGPGACRASRARAPVGDVPTRSGEN
jgi:hypothetical protein